MSQRSFGEVNREIAKVGRKIKRLEEEKGRLKEELQAACNHPKRWLSHRGSGATICDRCDKMVDYHIPRIGNHI